MSRSRNHLASLVEDFDRRGSDVAIVDLQGVREKRTTYRELTTLSRRFACELQDRGIAKGDRVVLWGENSASWVAAFFGCVLNGSLAVPIDAASPATFVESLLNDVAPKLVVSDPQRTALLPSGLATVSLVNMPDLITRSTGFAVPEREESDPLQIIFTSGTTGNPKGVVHTHRNVLASVRPIESEIGKYLRFEKPFHPIRILHTLPLSHVFGQFMALWVPPLLGAEIHFENRLVASELVDHIRSRRISVLAAVPRILDLLQSHLQQQFPNLLERLKAAAGSKALGRWWKFRDVHRAFGFKFWAFVCGGASLSSESERFWNGLGFVLIQGYGMTETTALVSLNHPFKLARGSVGQVLPGREVRLGNDGEVLVRGETISNTTWQHGQLRESESEWLATGDLAAMDEGGNLRFKGRKKDVIVTAGGLNIYPEDLEGALQRQEGVVTCSVLEVEGASGPEPLAVLVLSPGSEAAAAVNAANHTLADFQQIRQWLEWPEPDLPRTSTGKVLKREIVKRIQAGEFSGSSVGTQGDNFELDSLGRVQLQAQLETRYGVALDDAALQRVQTEQDLQALLRSASTKAVRESAGVEHKYPKWPWAAPMQTIRAIFLELVAMPLLRFLAKPTVRVRPKRLQVGPYFLVANHITSYDVPFLLYPLPGRIRQHVAVAMSGEMILDWRLGRNQGHWFLNWLGPLEYLVVTALFNIFPLPQRSGFRRSFRHAGEAVDRGWSVLVFPEGRRSDDGQLAKFKTGAGLLWKELNIPALPLYIEGLGQIKSKRGRWFRTGTISVSLGEPIDLPAGTPEELTEILQHSVAKLRE